MPTYEYQCQTCDNVMEVFQKLKDNKLEEYCCNKCNSVQPVKKIITSMNFTLIGRGWAKDGYMNTYDTTLDKV